MLTLLKNTAVALKHNKRQFFTETIGYLGHVIHLWRIEIASCTTDVTRRLQVSTSFTERWSLFKLCTVFWRFVSNFVRTGTPLSRKLREGHPLKLSSLNEEKTESMNAPKKALITSSVLELPNSTGHVNLDTDSRTVQVWFVLLQQQ